MTLEQNLFVKSRYSSLRFRNKFFSYKDCSPHEEIDRTMRRFETGLRCSGKHWFIDDKNDYYHR